MVIFQWSSSSMPHSRSLLKAENWTLCIEFEEPVLSLFDDKSLYRTNKFRLVHLIHRKKMLSSHATLFPNV